MNARPLCVAFGSSVALAQWSRRKIADLKKAAALEGLAWPLPEPKRKPMKFLVQPPKGHKAEREAAKRCAACLHPPGPSTHVIISHRQASPHQGQHGAHATDLGRVPQGALHHPTGVHLGHSQLCDRNNKRRRRRSGRSCLSDQATAFWANMAIPTPCWHPFIPNSLYRSMEYTKFRSLGQRLQSQLSRRGGVSNVRNGSRSCSMLCAFVSNHLESL